MATWPRLELQPAARAAPKARRPVLEVLHSWRQTAPGLWRCGLCGEAAKSASACSRRRQCGGADSRMSRLILDERLGHDVVRLEFEAGAVFVCMKCGRHASWIARRLRQPCEGTPSEAYRRSRPAKWRAGLNPLSGQVCLPASKELLEAFGFLGHAGMVERDLAATVAGSRRGSAALGREQSAGPTAPHGRLSAEQGLEALRRRVLARLEAKTRAA